MTSLATIEATFIATAVFILGLMIGSFLNVVIYRLPADESIVFPGSHCPNCNRTLTAWENIPVVSWLVQGAKCKGCKQPISWRYPAIELATGLLFLFVYQSYGLTLQTAFLLVLISLCMVTFWIDMDHMVILDVITLPGVVLGLLYSALVTNQFWSSLAGALMGVAVLMLINNVTLLIIQRDGMGGGDYTLIAMLGAWLGLQQTVLALGIAMIAGALMGILVMFGRWAAQRYWQPFAIALAAGYATFFLFGLLFVSPIGPGPSFPGMLWGAHLTDGLRVMNMAMAGMMGASLGWAYVRMTKDEDFTEIPFGPALVLGGLGSLFWGVPLLSWYFQRLGTF